MITLVDQVIPGLDFELADGSVKSARFLPIYNLAGILMKPNMGPDLTGRYDVTDEWVGDQCGDEEL